MEECGCIRYVGNCPLWFPVYLGAQARLRLQQCFSKSGLLNIVKGESNSDVPGDCFLVILIGGYGDGSSPQFTCSFPQAVSAPCIRCA